jgi:hypothetical protein
MKPALNFIVGNAVLSDRSAGLSIAVHNGF